MTIFRKKWGSNDRSLHSTASFYVFSLMVSIGASAVGSLKNHKRTFWKLYFTIMESRNLWSDLDNILHCGDVITDANFGDELLRRICVASGEILGYFIHFPCRP